jgi:hypothetical protein
VAPATASDAVMRVVCAALRVPFVRLLWYESWDRVSEGRLGASQGRGGKAPRVGGTTHAHAPPRTEVAAARVTPGWAASPLRGSACGAKTRKRVPSRVQSGLRVAAVDCCDGSDIIPLTRDTRPWWPGCTGFTLPTIPRGFHITHSCTSLCRGVFPKKPSPRAGIGHRPFV